MAAAASFARRTSTLRFSFRSSIRQSSSSQSRTQLPTPPLPSRASTSRCPSSLEVVLRVAVLVISLWARSLSFITYQSSTINLALGFSTPGLVNISYPVGSNTLKRRTVHGWRHREFGENPNPAVKRCDAVHLSSFRCDAGKPLLLFYD
ncbi:hypothetical protein KSP39_PZI016883 [Platanthera zijinensis]|uniref:Uncharacterized protein n=1 Tax=Platanthera zijinensis TaxID=2320716 RepID=A0AAP0G0M6_9ASPA